MTTFNINYRSVNEKDIRRQYFSQNYQKVKDLNSKSAGKTTYECNEYCDLSAEEQNLLSGLQVSKNISLKSKLSGSSQIPGLDSNYDLRNSPQSGLGG